MATIGQQLTTPEVGWVRYADNDTNITYVGTFTRINIDNPAITYTFSNINGDKVKFNFIGTKFRIISFSSTTSYAYSDNIDVKIDGVTIESYNSLVSTNLSTPVYLVYEKLGLENKEHTIEITNNRTNTGNLNIKAIDSDGILKPYNTQIPTQIYISNSNTDIYKNVYVDKQYKVDYQLICPLIKTNITEMDSAIDENFEILGSGKVFSLPVDCSKWANISNIVIK